MYFTRTRITWLFGRNCCSVRCARAFINIVHDGVCNSNADRLEASAKELRKDVANLLGRNCDEMIDTVTCDIRDEKQVKEMVKSILSKHQRIDFLVNNGNK